MTTQISTPSSAAWPECCIHSLTQKMSMECLAGVLSETGNLGLPSGEDRPRTKLHALEQGTKLVRRMWS